MTIQDWILLSQSVVLLFTAIVIAWYTVETHNIRKETREQNLILSEQLVLMRESIKTQSRLISPRLNCTYDSGISNAVAFDVFNTGGAASDLIATTIGNFKCEISKNVVSRNEHVILRITAPDLSQVDGAQIQITCNDQLDKPYSMLYRYGFPNRTLVKI